jgi:hypothetical protein
MSTGCHVPDKRCDDPFLACSLEHVRLDNTNGLDIFLLRPIRLALGADGSHIGSLTGSNIVHK